MSDSSGEEALHGSPALAAAQSLLQTTELEEEKAWRATEARQNRRLAKSRHRKRATMRLDDTQESVHQIEADKPTLTDHRYTIDADQVAKQEQAAKVMAASASPCSQGSTQGSQLPTKLPFDIWSNILERLCPASLSVLEGPSTIARYIINAQLSCRECQAASGAAWGALAALIQADVCNHLDSFNCSREQIAGMTTGCRWMPWRVRVANSVCILKHKLVAHIPWDQVVSDPMSVEHAVLEEACTWLGVQGLGTQAVLALRLLQYFGIDRPCPAPALILLAIKHEKAPYSATQWNQPCYKPVDLSQFAVSQAFKHFTQTDIGFDPAATIIFLVRKVLASNFTSTSCLLGAYAWTYAYMYRHRGTTNSRRRKRIAASTAPRCACGNQRAAACSQNRCKNCCFVPYACTRHHPWRR